MRCDEYEAMQEQAAKANLLERILRAEQEYSEGKFSDGEEFIKEVKAKYAL